MNLTTTLTTTQVILTSTLLGLLLAWMATFAVLALRSYTRDTAQHEESAANFPPVTPAPTSLQMIAISPATPLPAQTAADEYSNTGEMETFLIG